MAQIEEDDLKNYNLKRFDCEDPFFMEIFALKVDDAGYMVFPGPTIVNSWINLTSFFLILTKLIPELQTSKLIFCLYH